MANLRLAITSTDAKRGAEEFRSATEGIKKEAIETVKRISEMQQAFKELAASGKGIVAVQADFGRTAAAASQSLRSYSAEMLKMIEHSKSGAEVVRNVDQYTKELEKSLKSAGFVLASSAEKALAFKGALFEAKIPLLEIGSEADAASKKLVVLEGVLAKIQQTSSKVAVGRAKENFSGFDYTSASIDASSVSRLGALKEYSKGFLNSLDLLKEAGQLDEIAPVLGRLTKSLLAVRTEAEQFKLTKAVTEIDSLIKVISKVELEANLSFFDKFQAKANAFSVQGFQERLSKISEGIRELDQQAKKSAFGAGVFTDSKVAKDFGAGVVDAGKKLEKASDIIAKATSNASFFGMGLKEAAREAEELAKKTRAIDEGLKTRLGANEQQRLNSLRETEAGIAKKLAMAEFERAQQANAVLENLRKRLALAEKERYEYVNSVGRDPMPAPARKDNLSLGLEGYEKRMAGLVASTKQGSAAIEELGTTAFRTRSFVSQLFLGFSAAFAVRAAVRGIIDDMKEYETSIATLKAVTRAVPEDFAKIEEAVRKVGINSVYGANQAAVAMTALAKAGFSVEEAISALPGTLDFATVAKLSLTNAAEIGAKVMRQYGLDVSRLSEVLDSLSTTALGTTTDVGPLSESLAQVGPIASSLNNTVQETVAAIGVLSERVKDGSSAGTALKGVFVSLLNPSDDAKRAIGELRSTIDQSRLSIDDLNPRTKSLQEILDVLKNSTLDAGSAAIIFQRRFSTQGLVLAQNADRVRELTKVNNELIGTTKKTADTINDTLTGSFARFGSVITEANISLGEAGLGKGLRATLDFFGEVVYELTSADASFKDVSISAKITAEALELVAIAGTGLIAINLIGYLNSVKFGLAALASAYETVALTFMIHPIAATIVAIGAAAAGIWALSDAFDSAEESAFDFSKSAKQYEELFKQFDRFRVNLGRSLISGNQEEELAAITAGVNTTLETIVKLNQRYAEFQRLASEKKLQGSDFQIDAGILSVDSISAESIKNSFKGLGIDEALDEAIGGRKMLIAADATRVYEVALQALVKRQEEVREAIINTPNPSERYKDAKTDLEEYLAELEHYISISHKSQIEQDVETRLFKMKAKAIGEEKDVLNQLSDEYRERLTLAEAFRASIAEDVKAVHAADNALQSVDQRLAEYNRKLQVAEAGKEGGTTGGRAAAIKEAQLEVQALLETGKDSNISRYDDIIADIVGRTYDLTAATKEANAAFKEQESEADRIANQNKTATKSVEEFVKRLEAQAEAYNDTAEAQTRAGLASRFMILASRGAISNLEELKERFNAALATLTSGQNSEAAKNALELVERYEMQANAIGKTTDELARENAQRLLNNIARDKEIAGLDELQKRLDTALDTIDRANAKGRDRQAQQIVSDLKAELALLKLTNDERAVAIQLKKLDDIATKGTIENYDALRAEIEELTKSLTKEQKIESFSKTLAEGVGYAFENIILDIDNAEQHIEDFLRNVTRLVVNQAFTQPLTENLTKFFQEYFSSLFSGLANGIFGGGGGGGGGGGLMQGDSSAKGSYYENGNRYGYGGMFADYGEIIDTPTAFLYGGGRRKGVMGEAGPETILPLSRGSDGKLGVQAVMPQQSQTVVAPPVQNITNNVRMTVVTPSVGDFGRSQRQIKESVRRRT